MSTYYRYIVILSLIHYGNIYAFVRIQCLYCAWFQLTKQTRTAIMKLYENTKAMSRSPDGDTNFFSIVSGDTLSP